MSLVVGTSKLDGVPRGIKLKEIQELSERFKNCPNRCESSLGIKGADLQIQYSFLDSLQAIIDVLGLA